MADAKLAALSTGAAIAATDLFYSAQDAGGGSFTQVKQAATAFRTYLAASGIARTQRLVTSSPTVASTDQIINCNISSGSPTCTLPLASTRAGVPLTFKDVGGQFLAHSLTISPTGPDTIEGLASLTLSNNYAAVTLTPANDGTTAGWYVL